MTLLDDKATHEKTLYVAHLWIQAHGRCPDVVRERVFSVLGMVLDGGRTGSKQLLQAIRSMFSRTDARAGLRDRERLVRFLTEVDLGAIHDGRSEGVALAVAVGASLPGILDEVLAAGVRHEANALALARAFFQRDKSDPRLDTLTSEFPAVRDLLDRLRVERIGSRSLG